MYLNCIFVYCLVNALFSDLALLSHPTFHTGSFLTSETLNHPHVSQLCCCPLSQLLSVWRYRPEQEVLFWWLVLNVPLTSSQDDLTSNGNKSQESWCRWPGRIGSSWGCHLCRTGTPSGTDSGIVGRLGRWTSSNVPSWWIGSRLSSSNSIHKHLRWISLLLCFGLNQAHTAT